MFSNMNSKNNKARCVVTVCHHNTSLEQSWTPLFNGTTDKSYLTSLQLHCMDISSIFLMLQLGFLTTIMATFFTCLTFHNKSNQCNRTFVVTKLAFKTSKLTKNGFYRNVPLYLFVVYIACITDCTNVLRSK